MSVEPSEDPAEQAVSLVRRGLSMVLQDSERAASAAGEADIQRALHLLRQSRSDPAFVLTVERISTTLFTMSRSKLTGRPNLHASQTQRLKRLVAETGLATLPA